jgi:plastocyanin
MLGATTRAARALDLGRIRIERSRNRDTPTYGGLVRQMAAEHATRRSVFSISSLALFAALVALAGCGSSGSSSSSSSTTAAAPPTTSSSTAAAPTTSSSSAAAPTSASGSLGLEANKEGQLEYNTKTLSAKAGNVSIDFTNASPLAHNVTIESSSGAKVGATPTFSGGSKTLSVNLKPGTYKFFCSVPGHRQAGMEGTLTVK